MLGNVKRALDGTYHAWGQKYAPRYLAEFSYRFNRRYQLADLVPRLAHVAVQTPPLPYRLLTVAPYANQEELRMVCKTEGLCDGPEVLAKIRNDLVHAEMRTNVCLDAYLEARDLGQWYVELLLLTLFGYKGQYANRLAYEYEGRYEPEIVPWAQSVEEADSNSSERL